MTVTQSATVGKVNELHSASVSNVTEPHSATVSKIMEPHSSTVSKLNETILPFLIRQLNYILLLLVK